MARVALFLSEMGLRKVEYRYGGGSIDWVVDRPVALLSTDKIVALGWKPKTGIEEGIRKKVRHLIASDR